MIYYFGTGIFLPLLGVLFRSMENDAPECRIFLLQYADLTAIRPNRSLAKLEFNPFYLIGFRGRKQGTNEQINSSNIVAEINDKPVQSCWK